MVAVIGFGFNLDWSLERLKYIYNSTPTKNDS